MIQKNISLDGIHEQLIDINNGMPAFGVSIVVTPAPDEMDKQYSIGIGTQAQIDNKKEISFSDIKGVYKKSFSHSPVNPTGDPDVFYLIMTSKEPVNNINIIIDLVNNRPVHTHHAPPIVQEKEVVYPTYAKYAIALLIIAVGSYFLYKFWKKTKDSKTEPARKNVEPVFSPAPPVQAPVPVQVPVPAPVQAPAAPAPVQAPAAPAPVKVAAPVRMSVESVESPVKRHDKTKTGKPTFSFY